MTASLLVKLWMVSRRDLLTAVRYRLGFWLQAFGVAAELAASFYLALAIGPGFRPDGVEYFPFLLVGTAFHGFLVTGVHQCVSTVRDAQATGTMEVLMTTSTPAPVCQSRPDRFPGAFEGAHSDAPGARRHYRPGLRGLASGSAVQRREVSRPGSTSTPTR